MDAAAHPAGGAFEAQPEAQATAPAKPAAQAVLEPGAKWKALSYKLQQKISNAAAMVFIGLYIPPLMVWGCWANSRLAAQRRLAPETKFIFANVLYIGVAIGLIVLVVAGYHYLRYLSPNLPVFWDGVRGYYHKWRTHRNNARTAIVEMAANPALRPKKDVRMVASIGRDALVFGLLAGIFVVAAVGIFVGNQFDLFDGLDTPDQPYPPGEVFLFIALLAAFVLGLFALGKGWEFFSAWQRFVFASVKRGILGWWRVFSASDDWKRFVSLRLTFAAWRCTLFAVLLGLLVWGTHAGASYVITAGYEYKYWKPRSKLFAVAALKPFRFFRVSEIDPEHRSYQIETRLRNPTFESLAERSGEDWYSVTAVLNIEKNRHQRAQCIGWTDERMAKEIDLAAKDLDALRQRPPLTADEFEAMLEPLKMEGFKWERDLNEFYIDAVDDDFWFEFSPQREMRAEFDGGRLMFLERAKDWENYTCFDFARACNWEAGIRKSPATIRKPKALSVLYHLPFWLGVFACAWSLLLAPLLFLRFTYDPDKERAQQAAAPSSAPAAPPST